MHRRPTVARLVQRLLQRLGAVVLAACAVEGVCEFAIRLWPAPHRAEEMERPLGLDAAVGYGPVIGGAAGTRTGGGCSRFFTTESFRPDRAAGDADGSAARPGLRILTLGGSTTDRVSSLTHAGAGGDWPHLLGRELAARGRAVEIANAGLVGCLAAQELTRLIAILPDHRFDVVISLTGINETYFADRSWYRDPDERMSPKFVLAAFEELADGGTLSAGGQTLVATGIGPWLRRRAPLRLVDRLRDTGAAAVAGRRAGPNRTAAEWEQLATPAVLAADRRAALERAAAAWLTHVRLMAAVSREFDVRYIAALQPALGVGLSRAELVRALRESIDRGQPDTTIDTLVSRPGYLESLEALYQSMRAGAAGQPWFLDLSGPDVIPASAAGYDSPRYPNARGNRLIAARLADAVGADR